MHLSADVLYSHLRADLLHCLEDDSSCAKKTFACHQLLENFLKKFNPDDKPSETACSAALDKFLAVNDRCGAWVFDPRDQWEVSIFHQLKLELERFWFIEGVDPLISDYRQCFIAGYAGPGASLRARDTDLYTKMFDGPVTFTGGVLDIWDRCCAGNEQFFFAEAKRSVSWPCIEVDASNYSFVNKNVTVARGICTEPSLNMWLQLGAGEIIERRLRQVYKLDKTVQPEINRVLAWAGSLTGDLATIDLASASDSISLRLLKTILPRSFFGVLSTLRSPSTRLPDGRKLELNMVSTMGNGFTFPLQTMLFAAVVSVVARDARVALVPGLSYRPFDPAIAGNFGVFGDDIICPAEIAGRVIRVLNLLGFHTNTDKSFVVGPFRESCGADFFRGRNVRPVYLKKLASPQDVYTTINSLSEWACLHKVDLSWTLSILVSALDPKDRLFVPLDENDDAGIRIPLRNVPFHVPSRAHGLHRYFRSEPNESVFYILGGHCWTYRDQVKRGYNSYGLSIAFLSGSIRGCRVTLRQRVPRYRTKQKWTPRWDHLYPVPHSGISSRVRFRELVILWAWLG